MPASWRPLRGQDRQRAWRADYLRSENTPGAGRGRRHSGQRVRLILRDANDADLGLEVLPKRRIGRIESGLQVDFKDIPGADEWHLVDFLHAPRSAGHHDDLV